MRSTKKPWLNAKAFLLVIAAQWVTFFGLRMKARFYEGGIWCKLFGLIWRENARWRKARIGTFME